MRTLTAAARSKLAPGNCSFIQTLCVTDSSGSPTSPDVTPPCRAMRTCFGWRPRWDGWDIRRPRIPRQTVLLLNSHRPWSEPPETSDIGNRLRPDIDGVASHALL